MNKTAPVSFRGWMKRHPVRAVVYAAVALGGILTFLVLPVLICHSSSPVLTWLLDRSLLHRLAEQYSIRYSIESLQLSCFRSDGFFGLSGHGIEVELLGRTPLITKIQHVIGKSTGEIELQGVHIGTAGFRNLSSIDTIHIKLRQGTFDTSGIRIADSSDHMLLTTKQSGGTLFPLQLRASSVLILPDDLNGPMVSLQGFSTSTIKISPGQRTGLALEAIHAQDLTLNLIQENSGAWNLSRISTAEGLLQELSSLSASTIDALRVIVRRTRTMLLWSIIGIALALTILKLLSVLRVQPPFTRWILTLQTAAVPIVAYLLLSSLLPAFSACLVSACPFDSYYYRRTVSMAQEIP